MDQNGGWKLSYRRSGTAFGVCRITSVLTLVFRVYCVDSVRNSLDAVRAKVEVTILAEAVNIPKIALRFIYLSFSMQLGDY